MLNREYWFGINGQQVANEEAMVARLLDEDILFVGSRPYYCSFEKKVVEETLVLFILINDVFVPASDGESITSEQLPDLFRLFEQKDTDGIIEWVALKRGQQPRKRTKERMVKAGTWTDEMEKLIVNKT